MLEVGTQLLKLTLEIRQKLAAHLPGAHCVSEVFWRVTFLS